MPMLYLTEAAVTDTAVWDDLYNTLRISRTMTDMHTLHIHYHPSAILSILS